MTTYHPKHLFAAALIALCAPAAMAQSVLLAQAAPAADAAPAPTPSESFDRALNKDENWYFSWGYSRQQYAPSDIHVSQPSQGNEFTVHQAKGSDFPSSIPDTLSSLVNLDFTNPQENIRIGKFMNEDQTFAIEFSLDHSKYQTDEGQTAHVTGTVNGAAYDGPMVLDANKFNYALHNGLNHVMINAVWLRHLSGPVRRPGQLQLISRVGAGILLPHADNTIMGKANEVGPKNDNICCTNSKDWWQINGWTAGVEVGLRYRVYKNMYLELTQKFAYGELRNVPVYQGVASQNLWMSEQVFSAGFLF